MKSPMNGGSSVHAAERPVARFQSHSPIGAPLDSSTGTGPFGLQLQDATRSQEAASGGPATSRSAEQASTDGSTHHANRNATPVHIEPAGQDPAREPATPDTVRLVSQSSRDAVESGSGSTARDDRERETGAPITPANESDSVLVVDQGAVSLSGDTNRHSAVSSDRLERSSTGQTARTDTGSGTTSVAAPDVSRSPFPRGPLIQPANAGATSRAGPASASSDTNEPNVAVQRVDPGVQSLDVDPQPGVRAGDAGGGRGDTVGNRFDNARRVAPSSESRVAADSRDAQAVLPTARPLTSADEIEIEVTPGPQGSSDGRTHAIDLASGVERMQGRRDELAVPGNTGSARTVSHAPDGHAWRAAPSVLRADAERPSHSVSVNTANLTEPSPSTPSIHAQGNAGASIRLRIDGKTLLASRSSVDGMTAVEQAGDSVLARGQGGGVTQTSVVDTDEPASMRADERNATTDSRAGARSGWLDNVSMDALARRTTSHEASRSELLRANATGAPGVSTADALSMPTDGLTSLGSSYMFHASSSGTLTAALPASNVSASSLPLAPQVLPMHHASPGGALAENIRWMVAEGHGGITVNVSPSGMGPITVHAVMEGEQLNVSIMANQVATRDQLESALPRIREQLLQHGLEQARVDVGGGGNDRSTGNGSTDGRARPDAFAGHRSSTQESDTVANESGFVLGRASRGLIDSYA